MHKNKANNSDDWICTTFIGRGPKQLVNGLVWSGLLLVVLMKDVKRILWWISDGYERGESTSKWDLKKINMKKMSAIWTAPLFIFSCAC